MASNKKVISFGLDYSDFSGGITEINRKMGLLDAEFRLASEQAKSYGGETDILKLKQEQLTQKITLQAKKVDEAKKAHAQATETGGKSEKQMDALSKSLLNQQTTLVKLQNELTDTSTKLNKTGDSMENTDNKTRSFGDSIRGMASSLGLEVSPMVEGLASKFDGVSESVGTAIIGIGAIVTAFAKATFASANMADDLLTLSDVTGITTDQLQKMQYASAFLDVEVDTMTNSMTKLTRNMNMAREGTKLQDDAFKKLHIRYKEVNGELRDANTVFYETIDALGKVKNETERDALAMTLMGKSAKDLNPLIEAGSERLRELGIEAENMGVIMGEDSLDKLGRMKDAMDKMEATTGALKDRLGLALLPVLTVLFEAIGKIPTPVLQTIVILASVIASIVLVVKAIKEMTGTAGQITSFFKGIDAPAMKTVAIILAVVAALVALAVIIAVISGKSSDLQRSMDSVGSNMGKLTSGANEMQNSLTNATQRNITTTYPQTITRIPNNYSGTDDFEGGRTWINEGRPEVVTLPSGSKIEPTNGDKGSVNTYHITIDAKNVKEFNDIVRIAQGQRQAFRRGVVV